MTFPVFLFNSASINLFNGLVSFWELHEFATPYQDYIGTNTLNNSGSPLATTATTIGALPIFAGQYLTGTDTGLPTGSSNWTFSTWIETTSPGVGEFIFSWGTGGGPNLVDIYVNSSGRVALDNGVITISGSGTVNDGNLHNIVIQYNGTTVSIYIDGVLDLSTAIAFNVILSGTCEMSHSGGFGFIGLIGNVGVWTRLLSHAEIVTLAGGWAPYPAPQPFSWWSSDEGTGSTVYDWAYSNTGTNTDALYYSDCPFLAVDNRFSLNFNGSTSVVTTTDTGMPTGSSPRTMMCWLNTTDTTGSGNAMYHFCVDYGTVNTGQSFVIGYRTDSGRAFFSTLGGPALDGTSVVNDGLWHHIAATYDGTTATIYVDGVTEASTVYSVYTVLSGSLTIGYPQRNDFSITIGNIDDVRIYDVCLTAPQIATIAVPQPLLIGWWKFDEGTLPTAFDSVGGTNNGTITGAAYDPFVPVGITPNPYSLLFNGSTDHVTMTDTNFPSGASPWSMTAWINSTSNANQDIFSWGNHLTGSTTAEIYVNSFTHTVAVTNNFSPVTGSIVVNDGNWHNVVVTYDGLVASIYIDGVLDVSASYSISVNKNGFAHIGCWTDGSTNPFSGFIDDVRLYGACLT